MTTVLGKADEDVRRTILAATLHEAFDDADANADGSVSGNERDEYMARFTRRYPEVMLASAPNSTPPEPTTTQLLKLSLRVAVPFVGFGFLDNAIMVTAGDQIETSFGVVLGLSSMAAAGLGNTVSDVLGIQASGVIERSAGALGLPDPELSASQLETSPARRANVLASMLGITIGCLLGLLPLLVMEDEETRGLRKTFKAVDRDGSGSITMKEYAS